MRNLILGIGDVHVLLQDMETDINRYGYDIALLSTYTNQEIIHNVVSEIVDEERNIKFIDDKSYHKTPPTFELRFGNNKFEISDFFYIKNYENFVREKFESLKCEYLSQLSLFDNIIIVCRLSNFEALYCLPFVSKKLNKNVKVTVLACFACNFESEKRINYGKKVCDELIEADIETNVLFPSEYLPIASKLPVKIFFRNINEMLKQSLTDILSYSDFVCDYVKKF